MKSCAIVVLGLSPTGLYVIREAVDSGATVIGFSDSLEAAAMSQYLTNRGRSTVVPIEQLEQQLQNLSGEYDSLGIIPTTDRHAEFLVNVADRLPDNFHVAGIYRDGTALVCLDKSKTMEVASAAGICVPWSVDLAKGWPEEGSLSFPLIVKPKAIHLHRHWLKGKKLFVCRDSAELEEIRERPEFHAEDWTLQELIDGPESNILVSACFRSRGGDTPNTFVGRKLRQFPPEFGSASLLISDIDEDVLGASHRLLDAMNFNGIAGIEFKRSSSTGELKLVEINPRPGLWFEATNAKGHHLVCAQVNEWFGTDFEILNESRSIPVVWRYALKDLWVRWSRRLGKAQFVLPESEVNVPKGAKTVWAVFNWRDPAPALFEVTTYFRKSIARLFH